MEEYVRELAACLKQAVTLWNFDEMPDERWAGRATKAVAAYELEKNDRDRSRTLNNPPQDEGDR